MEKQNNSPFLGLLREENLQKIQIDDELIPTFKVVIYKIDEFFKKNKLLDCKDWNTFFEKFLLSPSEEQLSIVLYKRNTEEPIGGEYNKEDKILSVSNNNINSLCHEFIHFLVMHDSNSFNAKISDSNFFNEGMTEFMTSCIIGNGNSSCYFREFEMSEFYCKLVKNKNAFIYFLNDSFAFEDDYSAPSNLIRSSDNFQNFNTLSSYLTIQRELIRNGVNDYNINSFDDFVDLVTIINQRPKYDGDYIENIFEKITDKYLFTLDITEEEKVSLKNKLVKFCRIQNKYQLYGDNEVAEYSIDDLHIAFDKKGNHYNDFPLSGEKYGGQCGFDPSNGKITVVHKDKRYSIDTNKMNCRNWATIYMNSYNQINNEIQSMESQSLATSSNKRH